jgi:1,4-dihydroxy-2-naphthoyl-CoA hydrolase
MDSASIAVWNNPVPDLGTDVVACELATLDGGAGFASYSQSTGGFTAQGHKPLYLRKTNAMIDPSITPEHMNRFLPNTLMEHLGIEFTEVGSDYLIAKMPVDKRTHQPYGLLHGGASAALAESVGSAGSTLLIDQETHYPVGIEINANHIRAERDGFVYAKATVLHRGRTSHVWDIRITNEAEKLVSVCRLTMSILERK